PLQCKRYFMRKEISRVSRNTYGRQLRHFFAWCTEKRIVKSNPMKGVQVPKAPSKVPNFLTREHYDRLLGTLEMYDTLSEEERADLIESTFGTRFAPKIHAGEAAWMAGV